MTKKNEEVEQTKHPVQQLAEKQLAKTPNSQLAIVKRDIVDVVGQRITDLTDSGELHLPANYSAENALMAAWLKLQSVEDRNKNLAINVCTSDSIANSLLDMIVQGLDPSKSQCYFVVYGKSLVCMRSYFGTIAVLKRIFGQQAYVWSECVYKGDEFEYSIEHGRKTIVKHVQKLENVDNAKLVAAYAVVEPGVEGAETIVEVMPIAKIKRAWQQGATKGDSPAHKGFGDEMAKKTVINRATKLAINASDDSYLVRAVRRQSVAVADAQVEAAEEIEANSRVIDFDKTSDADAAPTEGLLKDTIVVEDEITEADAESAADTMQAEEPIEPEIVETAQQEEVEDGSPTQKFNSMIEALELNASSARRCAAEVLGIDDVRKLGNAEFANIMSDSEAFLAAYNETEKEQGQPSLPGPSF